MTIASNYYEKKQLMKKLADELAELESKQEFKEALEFQEKLGDLMKSYKKSPKETLEALLALDPTLLDGRETKSTGRKKRVLKRYKNPHTGEEVVTRGGNHKSLNAWRKKWGRDEVQSWGAVVEESTTPP